MNGNVAPKSNLVGVADLVSQWGKQNSRKRNGEFYGILPGYKPPACSQGKSCEQGRSTWLKRKLVRSDKPNGKNDRKVGWKSDCLIVLRDWESQLHGEAGSRR